MSFFVFTSSRDKWMGTLFNLVHCILTATRLQVARLSLNQLGSSKSSVNTSSFSSRFFSSPSPFNVDNWIWSWDKFFANLKLEFWTFFRVRFQSIMCLKIALRTKCHHFARINIKWDNFCQFRIKVQKCHKLIIRLKNEKIYLDKCFKIWFLINDAIFRTLTVSSLVLKSV